MAKNNTLHDLSDFLSQNPTEIDLGKTPTKEGFINKAPNNLVEVSQLREQAKPSSNLDGITMEEIAEYLHNKAAKEDISFAELWMRIIEEGAKKDPLLKNTSLINAMRTARKTSMNVVLEGISQLIKNK